MVVRVLLFLGLILLTIAPTLTPDDGAARKRRRHKIIFNSVGNNAYAPIPSQGPFAEYPMEFDFTDLRKVGKIVDVNLIMEEVSHTNPDDIDVMLVAPNGITAVVMADVGGSGDIPPLEGVDFVLDDEASKPLPDTAALCCPVDALNPDLYERYRPADYEPSGDTDNFPGALAPGGATSLSTFDGLNPKGVWRLYIVDDFTADAGSFGYAEIEIRHKIKKKRR